MSVSERDLTSLRVISVVDSHLRPRCNPFDRILERQHDYAASYGVSASVSMAKLPAIARKGGGITLERIAGDRGEDKHREDGARSDSI